ANDGIAMDWMGMAMAPSAMPGMPTASESEQLRASRDLAADDVFTRLMIRHHAGGAAMADRAAEHGENASVTPLAPPLARVQRAEIDEMNNRRQALGLAPVDPSDVEREMARVHGH